MTALDDAYKDEDASRGRAVPRPAVGPSLVADVNDRNPFPRSWDEVSADDVHAFLSTTTDDEPLHWEAKSTQLRPEQVAKAVAGLANREGGYLILGASRDTASGTWRLDGVDFTHAEPATWLSGAIRGNANPPPHFDVRAWTLSNGQKAAVVQVQPNAGFLSLVGGRIPYRGPGETYWIEDGAHLVSVLTAVQFRSRALPDGDAVPEMHAVRESPPTRDVELSVGLGPDAFLAVAKQMIRRDESPAIRIFLSEATNAARSALNNTDENALGVALDRILDCGAVATAYAPGNGIALASIQTLQSLFDAGQRVRGGPNRLDPARVSSEILTRARALGGLAIRLEQWSLARALIVHRVDEEVARREMWFREGDVQASRAGLHHTGHGPLENGRVPIRAAAAHVLRLESLRPDGLADEDAIITSVCQFDFAIHMTAAWEMREAPVHAAYPYYAAWDGERVRPIAWRIVSDPACREELLGAPVSDDDLAALLRFVSHEADNATQGLGSWAYWDGFVEGRVAKFLSEHPVPAT